jgi:SEC-C motif domain protein
MSTPCYCGSSKSFNICCQPYHINHNAPTAEALMRSRFSAFATADVNHILTTQVKELSDGVDPLSLKAELSGQKWVNLQITHSSEKSVAFIASMLYNGILYTMQEHSQFIYNDGQWLYEKALEHSSNEREVKRNEPCPCGSSKKYKQCCQKAQNEQPLNT